MLDRHANHYRASAKEKHILKKVWSSALPQKVQGFLWKLMYGILPTRVSLASRVILLDSICFWCNSDAETGLHATRSCVISKKSFEFAYFLLGPKL